MPSPWLKRISLRRSPGVRLRRSNDARLTAPYSSAAVFHGIDPSLGEGVAAYEFSVDSRYFGGHCRVDCAGDRDCLWTDRAIWKAGQARECPAAGPTGAADARPAGACDSGSAQLANAGEGWRAGPCGTGQASLFGI